MFPYSHSTKLKWKLEVFALIGLRLSAGNLCDKSGQTILQSWALFDTRGTPSMW
ncbi:unnamed protein product [Acanthoscelides obtectus]|uniref:Uncharacterized protein n=1 Tax=Acanthoscelides obtectus TaxID=200917 RepID=A0A9P0JSZ3_ACAOB|nr:unnamed protein product [Acanthoscelides obtectus]CAK1668502.1 hypothetical protein AOBTE_LOCUS26443 [Acanthoscelides obtectus]